MTLSGYGPGNFPPKHFIIEIFLMYILLLFLWGQHWRRFVFAVFGMHLDCWNIKIFSLFGGFVRFEFYPFGLLFYGAFVHFCFSLSAHVIAWRECWLSTPVSCDHGIVHLDCWSIKIFSLFGVFVRFEFYPLGLFSYGTFVHFCFSLSAHVIAWWECWLSTPVSCDHGIVHLDCWSIKIFSLLGFFVHFEFYPLGLLSYIWHLFPFLLFSVRSHDRMTRMFSVHPCIMWSWDRAHWLHWLLEY